MIPSAASDIQLRKKYELVTGSPFLDSLTGLYNHGFFQVALSREIERCKRFGEPLSLAMIGIDCFASYNRQHDPISADHILKKIAGVILNNIRQVDLAARYNGDLFTVVFIKSEAKPAVKAAERIRTAVAERFCSDPTISVGIAALPNNGRSQEQLFKKALEALMKAKSGGKNRVYSFGEEPEIILETKPRVLIVDDEPRNVKLLDAMLFQSNYEIVKAYNGDDALSIVENLDLDIILLDIMMPGMDGYEVCRRIKGHENTRLIPVVLITALDDMESKVKGIEAGADDFITKPPNKMELLTRIKSLIRVKALNNNLASIENVLFSLATAVEAKDTYTEGHIHRVANLAVGLGKRMGLSKKEIQAIRLGGILHDVGKIGIASGILNKPGPLDPDEWQVMKEHPEAGYRICRPLEKNIGQALEIVRYHHEKLDGSGYPEGLKEGDIPLTAQLMAVVDIYDALVTNRPYRKAMPKEKAFKILFEEAKNGKLNKEVVRSLHEMLVKYCSLD
jgi:putative two-component system response regulator